MSGWSRRAVLRGLGAALPLPFLPSRLGGARADDAAPRRFVFVFAPNGMIPSAWEPVEEGTAYALPELLAPLAPVRDHVSVLTGLSNWPAVASSNGMDHAMCTSGWLSGTDMSRLDPPPGHGRTVDQVLADHIGQDTPWRSLALGSEAGVSCPLSACDQLFHVSWSSAGVPVARDIHPSSVFERLFGGAADDGATAAERAARRAARRSVLDYVLAEATATRAHLGADDQRVLDQYLTGVRDVERRLEVSTTLSCEAPEPDLAGLDVPAHVEAMNRLIVLALQCGHTRVVSYMIGNGQSERTFGFLGRGRGHHSYTHSGSDVAVRDICRWEVERFVDLVARLGATPTPTGTLLDETFALFGSGMGHGADHRPERLPILLAGRGGGRFAQGRHLRFSADTSLARLHLSLLQAAGAPAERFGDDGTSPLLDLT